MTRYLITTADERTWKFDRPVLFLGEWCRRYDRRQVWKKMDAVVAQPYGVRPEQWIADIRRIETIVRKALPQVTSVLNGVHGTRYSERYWEIVLGHWLARAVTVLFNRYHVVQQALDQHPVEATAVFSVGNLSLDVPDSLAFIYASDNDLWNHLLFSQLIADRGDVSIEPLPLPPSVERHVADSPRPVWRERALMAVSRWLSRLGKPLVRDSDAVLVNTYLPMKTELLLQVALGQVPYFYNRPSVERSQRDACMRARIMAFEEMASSDLEGCIFKYLPELMPRCFLEGYAKLRSAADALPWPKNPKFIFTSNNFDTDDVFKVRTAEMVEEGTPYFIGQHGAKYGAEAGTEYRTERTTPDVFFTWGWREDDGISVPAFIFRPVGPYEPRGGLLLVEDCYYHFCYPSDRGYEYGLYQENQFRFAERLPPHIHRHLTVRLHAGFRRVAWHDDQRWRDRSPKTHLDFGEQHIRRVVAKSRLVVHSYNSTGLLETLSSKIPTLCFWHHPLDRINSAARPYYDLLRSVGILFDSPDDAAEAVASRWEAVDAWWFGNEVQQARQAFCRQFARVEPNRVRTMKRLLCDAVASTHRNHPKP